MRNLAGQMPPSLAGGALAPGALFSVRGLRLGGDKSVTRVLLQQSQSEIEATLIKSGAEYLEARVPAGAAPGDADLVIVRDGQRSRPFRLRIAAAAFGIFAANGKGWGPAEGLGPPGGAVTLMGTGLGNANAVEVWGRRQTGAARAVARARRRTPGRRPDPLRARSRYAARVPRARAW